MLQLAQLQGRPRSVTALGVEISDRAEGLSLRIWTELGAHTSSRHSCLAVWTTPLPVTK